MVMEFLYCEQSATKKRWVKSFRGASSPISNVLVSYEDYEWRNHLREYSTALNISRLLTQSLLEDCEVFIFIYAITYTLSSTPSGYMLSPPSKKKKM